MKEALQLKIDFWEAKAKHYEEQGNNALGWLHVELIEKARTYAICADELRELLDQI